MIERLVDLGIGDFTVYGNDKASFGFDKLSVEVRIGNIADGQCLVD